MADRIPLAEAVEAGAWIECHQEDMDLHFRIRLLSFEKVDFNEVDEIDEVDLDSIGSGVLWILKLEVVNISKSTCDTSDFKVPLLMVDTDDFQFGVYDDGHLSCSSDYSKKSGLNNFYGKQLRPKIKVKGAITFILPDEETEYYITIEDGTIQEA